MGKRDERRSKKHKRAKTATAAAATATPTPAATVEQPAAARTPPVEEIPADDINCDTEVELLENDVTETDPNVDADECVDIEMTNDEDSTQQSNKTIEQPTSSQKNKKLATNNATSLSPATIAKKAAKKRRNSGTSSEEERWLTAIESGKLDDVDDEMKKIKDPKLMTARQRAMYDRTQDKEPSPGVEILMALPTGYREKDKPQTAEELQKAALKSQKRKQQADERREKDKKKTMDRLLKKQESNKLRAGARNKTQKPAVPMITYKNTYDGAIIQMPLGHEFPLKAQTANEPPKQKLCAVAGCRQLKVYNCAKTNAPLCSLACYQKNLIKSK